MERSIFNNVIYYCSVTAAIVLLIFLVGCHNRETIESKRKRIIIEMKLSNEIANPRPANFIMKSNLTILYRQIKNEDFTRGWNFVEAKVSKYNIRWVIYSDIPVEMDYGFGTLHLVSPGDSIMVHYYNEEPYYSGKGSNKLTMWKLLLEEERKLGMPTKNSFTINSIEDYLKWNSYLDKKIAMEIQILDTFSNKIQSGEYDYLKESIVRLGERDRIKAFQALRKHCKESSSGTEKINLNAVWDSTFNNCWSKWLWSLPIYYGSIYTLFDFNQLKVWRKLDFNLERGNLKAKYILPSLYYENAKDNFKGMMRERLIVYILRQIYIDTYGPDNFITQQVLKDYYSQPGFPEYKQWVKKVEEEARSNPDE